jgi:hypothetical protein
MSAPPWLPRGLRDMALHDPEACGRLMLQLLPAHGLVESRNMRYDLVIEEVGCLAVMLRAGQVSIAEQLEPRPMSEVEFRLTAALADFGAVLAGGRVRRLGMGARVTVAPHRRWLESLRALAQTPLSLQELHDAGVRLDPTLAYRVLALSIEPQWTARRRFTMLHEVEGAPAHSCCVYVDGERPVSIVSPPPRQSRASVRVRCPRNLFVPLLTGELTRGDEQRLVDGDVDSFTALQDWLARIEWSGAYGG